MNRLKGACPLFICGFRPFFVLTAVSAIGFMLTWVLLLGGWLGGWHPPGGPTAWHAHELLFGFAAAAVAGFALTAVPEFTATQAIGGGPPAPPPPRKGQCKSRNRHCVNSRSAADTSLANKPGIMNAANTLSVSKIFQTFITHGKTSTKGSFLPLGILF